jgi:hypothetical protein
MSFLISALIPDCQALLNGRPVTSWNNTLAEYARKTVIELSEDYKFPGLQVSGPVVSLIALQAMYSPNYFLAPTDAGLELNKVDSFFIFSQAFSPITVATQQNSGYQLKFSTINDIEVLINVPGQPTKWTRHEGNIWFGSVPDQNYSVQMRYIKANTFPNAGTGAANTDAIYFPDTWQDVVEYAVSMRAARDLNLTTKANELYSALYGDAKFQISGGIEGTPGLIFQRTSQERRDQTTTTKSMRLKMARQ